MFMRPPFVHARLMEVVVGEDKLPRVLMWFSCGAASAVAAKLAVEKYGDRCEVLYCDTLKYEHDDNPRFMADVSKWIGREIKILKSEKYTDIFDVFDKTGWLVGPDGARCTTELKKNVRKAYQQVDDIHIFGLAADESKRIELFNTNNPDLMFDWILLDRGITKSMCFDILRSAKIALPQMYKLGYKNNNCIGCVKGQQGYWNKIRVDFPLHFWRMCWQEWKMGVAINKKYVNGERIPVFLFELDPKAGRYKSEKQFDCGVLCD